MEWKVLPVVRIKDANEEMFRTELYPLRKPVLMQGLNIGDCRTKWTPEYLSKVMGKQEVKVHVSVDRKMDFLTKNFSYKSLPWESLIKRANEEVHDEFFIDPEEVYYLRSLGSDPRGREISDVTKHYPKLSLDISIPHLFPEESFFSSIFRVGSKGVQLWTHYDIMDNILIQVRGEKRVVLFNPEDAGCLYLKGDKSLVIDIDTPSLKQFPNFVKATRHECIMTAGDVLFIPALWLHNVTALEFGVAVNVFWRHLPQELYDKKDAYGNKDLIPCALALGTLEKAIKQLDALPEDYKRFYGQRMIATIQNKLNIRHS